ncbi:RasGEF domain-containing protein [Heterostelium album PN500]|uniref:non-specific serine/threonine protein kinase n=1 Tax=Heterostelium pallidum (strain ATCC 26659 / Pp 5 / PN500) TaxID=670386 RepID=D3BTI3_HETP5|nr:RasGEF domain-containing protein [Heterostelium album PN500]EFA75400.1 RasGEF domain-containing protein [Heterostelium album PN500]|eukprot:XP_020427534.1 RasGEF domain-containing protein [Heterostelium album PN500]
MAEQTDPGLPTQAIWDIPFENLEFKERIGKGSFGSVFRGLYLGLEVAIKKIEKADDPEYLKYIDREVSMLQSLRHPFIVQFSGICVHSTGLYIITEFVSGGDVRQLLKQSPPITWDKRLSIATDLAKVLVFLHAKKIIHRDLKSKNILLDEYQRIRLCDFGFARMNEQTKKARHMTMCGTEGWVAPEILLGMSYDTSCDVFSYGVVLAELITGRKPGVDLWLRTPETCFDIAPDELKLKAIPGCPSKLIDICQECCTYEPLSRPKFEDILSALKTIVIPPTQELKSPDVTPSIPPTVTTPPQQQQQTNVSNNNNNNNNNTTTTNNNNNNNNPTLSPTIAQSRRNISQHRKSQEIAQPINGNIGETTQKEVKFKPTDSVIGGGSNWRVGALKPPGYYTLKRKNTAGAQTALINHLIKMVERATSDYCYDTSYIQDLLLTYRCFATPMQLLELLTQRYLSASPENHSADMANWKKVHRVIQLRVIIFFKRWIDYYPTDFQEGDAMEEKLADFDRIVVQNSLASLSLMTTTIGAPSDSEPKLVAELTKKRNELSQATPLPANAQFPTSIIPPPPATGSEYLDIADINAVELARQFTIISGHNFYQIQPREYLEICWERLSQAPSPWVGSVLPNRPGANIHNFLDHYDDLVRFVSTEIVKHNQVARRAATIERFIEAADKCLSQSDFSSVFCIMQGLANPSVERLTDTFKQLNSKTNAVYEQLKTFVSKENDYKKYREILQDAQAPTIPHVRLLLDELFFIETSSPKLLQGGIVNFFHYRQLSRKILFTQQLIASGLHQFRAVPSIQKVLSKPQQELFDDEVIRHYSLICEPPVSL